MTSQGSDAGIIMSQQTISNEKSSQYNQTAQSVYNNLFNGSDALSSEKRGSFYQRMQMLAPQSQQKDNSARSNISASSSMGSQQKVFFNNQSCTGGSKNVPDQLIVIQPKQIKPEVEHRKINIKYIDSKVVLPDKKMSG